MEKGRSFPPGTATSAEPVLVDITGRLLPARWPRSGDCFVGADAVHDLPGSHATISSWTADTRAELRTTASDPNAVVLVRSACRHRLLVPGQHRSASSLVPGTVILIPAGSNASLTLRASCGDGLRFCLFGIDTPLVGLAELGSGGLRLGVVGIDRWLSALAGRLRAGDGSDLERNERQHLGEAAVSHILRIYARSGRLAPSRGGLAPWQVERVRGYLQDHLCENTPVATLAGSVGLSVSHFTRAFRASVGCSPKQFELECRLLRAADLLSIAGSDTVGDIAAAVGFEDPSYFARRFRRRFGSTPAQFRRLQPSWPA